MRKTQKKFVLDVVVDIAPAVVEQTVSELSLPGTRVQSNTDNL